MLQLQTKSKEASKIAITDRKLICINLRHEHSISYPTTKTSKRSKHLA